MRRSPERDGLLLEEIIEHLRYAVEDVGQFASAEELALDRRSRNSAAKEIQQAQECAKSLSDQTTSQITQVPWRELRELRNVIVHEYGDIDWDVLYDTVTTDIPQIISELSKYQNDREQ